MYQRRVAYLGLRGNQLIRSRASIQGRNGLDLGTAGQLADKNKNRLVVEAQENLGALIS